MSSRRARQRLTGLAVSAVVAVGVYLAFLGWDRESDVDAVTGSTSGPYDTWQVVGCTLALGLLALAGGRAQRAWSTAAAVTVGFTAAWSVGAATVVSEDANLWPIGAALTAVGTFLWTALVAVLTRRLTRRT